MKEAMILPNGMKAARLVFVRSTDPEAEAKDWKPVPPDEVPLDLKDPGVLGQLLSMPGYMASPRNEPDVYYMVLRMPEHDEKH